VRSPQKLSDDPCFLQKTKTRPPPGYGKSRSVEREENQKQVFLPSHRPWESRTTRAIPTFPTAPTAAGFSTSLTAKVGVGPNETIERGQIKLTNALSVNCLSLPDRDQLPPLPNGCEKGPRVESPSSLGHRPPTPYSGNLDLEHANR
jgi:hypothetical protein